MGGGGGACDTYSRGEIAGTQNNSRGGHQKLQLEDTGDVKSLKAKNHESRRREKEPWREETQHDRVVV